MSCKRKLRKVNAKDLELFWNRLVHITLEQENASVVEKRRILMSKTLNNGADGEANWPGVVNFHCMQMSLVLSAWFIFGDDRNVVSCSSNFFASWQ